MEKKITKATFKSFVRRNRGKLHIDNRADFNGMNDGLDWDPNHTFRKAEDTDRNVENTLGVRGVWLVNGSRDYFQPYDDGNYQGIAVSNCCGYFTVAVPKGAIP